MKFLGVLVIAATIRFSPAVAQKSTVDRPSVEVARAIEGIVKMHQAWGPSMNSPNATLTLNIASNTPKAVNIHMLTTGLPKDRLFDLMSWPVTQLEPTKVVEGVTIDANGIPVCAGKPDTCRGTKPDDPIDLILPKPAPGEPMRVALVSGDIKVFAKIVPVPLRTADRGCSIDAVILLPGAEMLWFEGAGFAPNEAITVSSRSEKETREETKQTDATGAYRMVDMPSVDRKKHGKVSVTIQSSHCAPTITVPWGF